MAATSSSAMGVGAFREVKNLEDYLGELKERSEKRLKELKYERRLMHQKKVNVIAELQKEIQVLKEANKALKQDLTNREKEVTNSPEVQALKEKIKTLDQEKVWLEQVGSRKDKVIEDLRNQLEIGSQQPSDTSTTGNARELERLALVLKDREHELGEIRRESSRLKEIIEDMDANQRAQQQELEDAQHEAETLRAIVADLDAENNEQELLKARHEIESLKSMVEELQNQEAPKEMSTLKKECERLNRIIAEMKSEGSARELVSVKQEVDDLRSIVGELREQNAAQSSNAKETEDVIRNLKLENTELIKQIQHMRISEQKAIDVVRAESSRSDRIPSRPASAQDIPSLNDPDIVQKLHNAYEEIAVLYDIRDEIMADVRALREEIFNPQAMRKIIKVVRDRELASFQKAVSQLHAQVAEQQTALAQAAGDMEAMKENYEHKMKILQVESEGLVKHLREKWKSEFDRRRKLHNALLEMKGNIRVLCRIRPVLAHEKDGGAVLVTARDEETLNVVVRDGEKDIMRNYEFDRVFGPEEGQDAVFKEVSSLVTSVLDGYNVCIMAYGQTGSGKTHTMDGPSTDPGVNIRSLSELLKKAESHKEKGDYLVKASVLEIYNEQIIDLLSEKRDQKLDIKQDANGMYVPGLMIQEVQDMQDVERLISTGKKNRSTNSTNMNEHSSRSHLVFSVYVQNRNGGQGNGKRDRAGKLHLIDLAGSERLSRSGAEGERLKEAQNINKSLSALGDVIQALRQKSQHIPFRNSKLTRFLEDSLGRSSKCLLLANFNPLASSCGESKCSAEFASRVKKVELGRSPTQVSPRTGRKVTASAR